MYVVLGGAKQNVGDHLIVDRATKLLQAHRPEHELVMLPRWQPLDPHLDVVNEADAVILCGGPALQHDLYPGVYPLVADLSRIDPPLIAFGLGWKHIPGDEEDLARFRFARDAGPLLARLDRDHPVSVRDHLACRVLRGQGIRRVLMTGDPAWYDLEYLGREMTPPAHLREIVVSVPAAPIHHAAAQSLVEGLRERFPAARVVSAFHHGWTADPHVGAGVARAWSRLRGRLERAGYEVADLAGDLASMEALYGKADLHVGWRLHAHLLCLSRRKPSVLMDEDCRGRGASEALGLRSIRSWTDRLKIGSRRKLMHRREAVCEVLAFVDEELDGGFIRLSQVPQVIDRTYETAMTPFLEQLP